MILHRFCSDNEYVKYALGETLRSNKDHGAERGPDVSTAIGFCWFAEDPEEAKHWLLGIVDFDWCLTVDAPDSLMRECRGRYPDWLSPGVYGGTIYRREYCCTEYDNVRFPLIKIDSYSDSCPNASILRKFFPHLFC